MRKMLLACALGAMLLSGTARAVEVSADFSSALHTDYIFRGARLDNTGIASSAYLNLGLSNHLTVWGGLWNWTSLDSPINNLETDYDAGFTWLLPAFRNKVSLTAGYLRYDIQQAAFGRDTQEAYVGLDFDTFLNPYVYAYYDFDQFVGTYLVAGVRKSWTLGQSGWNLDANGAVGWDFGRAIDGFQTGLLSAALTYELEPGLTFGPTVDLWFPADKTDATAKNFSADASLGFNYSKAW